MAILSPTSRWRDPAFRRRTVIGYAFISPVVLGLIIWTFGPMLASFWFSLTDYKITKPPEFVGIDNYVKLFTKDTLFVNSLVVTIRYAAMYVVLGQVTSLALAVLLHLAVERPFTRRFPASPPVVLLVWLGASGAVTALAFLLLR